MTAPTPADENERLSNLESYSILDTGPESDYDDITRLASVICEVPVSLITFVDAERQWFKSRVGIDITETRRDIAFCSHAIHHDNLMIVADATQDNRFRNNPLVTGSPDIRFYAGMPLVTPEGFSLGTLCILDKIPRQISEQQKLGLQVLGRQVVKLLELRSKNLQLQKLAEVNSRLLSIIGHDLRSPFQAVKGMLNIYQSHDISVDEFNHMIPKLSQVVDSGSGLLEDLLEWASSQMNGQKISKSKICLKELIDNIIVQNIALLHEKANNARVNIASDTQVFADKKMTEFIVRNLLLNANKFTEQGSISFSTKRTGNIVEIRVEDTGVGMEEVILENLFSWTKRLSSKGTRGEKGSGLGLLFCREFVEAHGCHIGVTSKVNRGTTFYFTLPARRKD